MGVDERVLLGKTCVSGAAFLAVAVVFSVASPLLAQTPTPQFVYVAGAGASSISAFQLNSTTGALTPVPGSPFPVRAIPLALAVDPAGKFLFATSGNVVYVYAIDQSSGAIAEVPNSPFASGSGVSPKFLSVDPSSRFLFVANDSATANSAAGEIDVYEINSETGVLTPSPNTLNSNTATQTVNGIAGLYVHSAGNWLYVYGGTFTADVIQQYQISPDTGDLTLASSGTGDSNARSLVGAPNGELLFEAYGQQIGFVSGSGISPINGSLTGLPNYGYENLQEEGYPLYLAVDSTGHFLYTDIGSFIIPTTSGALVPITLVEGTHTAQPWVADLIGPFVFTAALNSESSEVGIASFQINPTSGTLTPAPGSPYITATDVSAIAVTGYPSQFAAPVATFSPTTFAFAGTIVGVPSAQAPIQLVNSGFATLTVGTISITGANPGDFSQTNNCSATLTAGASCTFNVTFIPTAVGERTASLNIADNSAGSPHSVALSGEGNAPSPAVTLVPGSFTFSNTVLGATSVAQGFTLTNAGTGVLNISSIGLAGSNPGDFTQSNNCGATVAVNASCTITVAFKPQALGSRSGNVTIVDDAPNSPQTIGLSGTATPAPIASFSPEPLVFSGQPVGISSASLPLQLTNTGTGPLTINTVSFTGANPGDFSQTNNCPASLAAAASCTFNVTFTPGAIGSRSASLTLTDNSATSPDSASFTGTGVPAVPSVTLNPNSFTFPSAMAGATGASQPFTLTNSGTGTLHLSSIALAGSNPGDFTQSNTCAATVAVSANCVITVTFKPQAVGVRTATVTIANDAATSPQTIALTGTGAAPFSIAPTGSAGTTVNLVPGQSSQYGMQFTSMPNFTGTVFFACMGAPTGSTCSISPASLPVTGTTTTQLNLTVNSTTSSTVVMRDVKPASRNLYPLTRWLFALLAMLLPAAFLQRKNQITAFKLSSLRLRHAAILLALSAGLMLSACGGAGGIVNNPPPASSGPAAGAYALTVVATSGNVSVSLNLTLNVQ